MDFHIPKDSIDDTEACETLGLSILQEFWDMIIKDDNTLYRNDGLIFIFKNNDGKIGKTIKKKAQLINDLGLNINLDIAF